ncbi:hypothetical protein [Bacillus infantis]|uniref:hypothetical protein n=1 Tax=Bacillus infantis TaxID=324767 RepID=UPI003CEACB90
MDGKKGLKNPTGFILKQLVDGKVIEDAKYKIRRAKESFEKLHKEENTHQYDYVAALKIRKQKEQEEEKEKRNENHDLEKLFDGLLVEEKQPKEEWMDVLES